MKIALELQPCCGNRSGVGMYTYELAKRMTDCGNMQFRGNVFNFLGRRDNDASLKGIDFPIRVNRLMPYGVYRRVWGFLPIAYNTLFGENTGLNIFFNYIVPPFIKGRVITTIYDMT